MKNLSLKFYKFCSSNFTTQANSKVNSINQVMPQKLKRKFYTNVDILEVKNENSSNTSNTCNTGNKPNSNKKNTNNNAIEKFINHSKFGETYYQILLDNKKCKTMYLDEFKIPNKTLAVLIAEEWAKQKEFVNLHSMQLNLFASSGIRISKDESLRWDVINSLTRYIESDQLCFLEEKIVNFIQNEEGEFIYETRNKIFEYLEENFGIKLKAEAMECSLGVFNKFNTLNTITNETIILEKQNKERFLNLLSELDPWVLGLMEQLIGLTKSPSLSIALLANLITPQQAYLLSHSEEYYQMKVFGEVEGHHDISNEMIMGKLYSAVCFHNCVYI